jgi:WD40 repeat protein
MNLKTDKVLFSFKQGQANSLSTAAASGNEVTSISFRTDSAAERFPYMATGSGDGRIYLWHLGCPGQAEEPRRLMLTLEESHGPRASLSHPSLGSSQLLASAKSNSSMASL